MSINNAYIPPHRRPDYHRPYPERRRCVPRAEAISPNGEKENIPPFVRERFSPININSRQNRESAASGPEGKKSSPASPHACAPSPYLIPTKRLAYRIRSIYPDPAIHVNQIANRIFQLRKERPQQGFLYPLSSLAALHNQAVIAGLDAAHHNDFIVFLFNDQLGEGGFKKVYRALYIPRDTLDPTLIAGALANDDSLTQEIAFSETIAGNHVLRPISPIPGVEGAIYPLFDGDLINYCRNNCLDIRRSLHIAVQIAEGLENMHHTGIIHRDVKPQNILVKLKFHTQEVEDVVVSDFGLSCRDNDREELIQEFAGTYPFMAPEYFNENEDALVSSVTNKKTDIWSLGISFFQLFQNNLSPEFIEAVNSRLPIFTFRENIEFTRRSYRSLAEPQPGTIDHLIYEMLLRDPNARPTITEVKNTLIHLFNEATVVPFLGSIEDEEPESSIKNSDAPVIEKLSTFIIKEEEPMRRESAPPKFVINSSLRREIEELGF